MTQRERLMTLLTGGCPDRVPWFGDLDYYATAQIVRGERPDDFKTSGEYIKWHRDLGVGYYLKGRFPFSTIIENCNVIEWWEGDTRFRRIETPKGVLREAWRWMPDLYTEGLIEHLMKSAEDIPAMIWLYENTHYEPDYIFPCRRSGAIADCGILLCYIPKSPFMHLATMDAGIDTVVMTATAAPDAFDELIEVMTAAHDRAAHIAVDSFAEAMMIPEKLSAEMIGKEYFEKYIRGYQEKWIRCIAEAGKYSFIHMNGSLDGLLRQVCSTGVTVLEALMPEPVGDVAIEDFASYAGESKTVLWGGIPGIYFTPCVNEAKFERHVRHVLSVMRSEPRYVLGVADQVPPDGLERRIRHVGELVEEYGDYA